ncbi:methyl-accepting chemotaxis protein [Parasalinivibrio latis]|uniref:methyl-accepting chemotaxis protein n=1 Tax=Parasalinivibrio latis TaxID=2952610 RepID=UPI0030E024AE
MFTSSLSLRKKLAFSASAAILVGSSLVMAVSFISSLNRLDTELKERLHSAAESYNTYVADWIQSKGHALSSFPTDADPAHYDKHVRQVRDSGQFDNVFLAFNDGSQINANNVKLPPENNDPRTWGWYNNAKAMPGQVFMDNPTVAAASGANVVSVGKVIKTDKGEAVLGADVEINAILQQLKNVLLPGDGHMFITTRDGKIFAHADTGLLNQFANTAAEGLTPAILNRLAQSGNMTEMKVNGIDSNVTVDAIPDTGLLTVIVVDHDSVVAPLIRMLWEQAIIAIAVIAACMVAFNLLCNYLFKPLRNVSNALETIAQGGGDLTGRLEITSKDEVGQLAENFNSFVGSLQALIQDIGSQARQLNSESSESQARALKQVDALGNQQQEVTMVATAVTEMSSATQEIAANAENAAQAAQESATYSEHGQHLVEKSRCEISDLAGEVETATGVIRELNQHAQDINGILSAIQGIAEQTNLLALNAAIEAARAGEQGRGFAVVADEVRVLSQRTHSSTEEIQSMITTLQATTNKAVEIMERSSEMANTSVDGAQAASESLTQISESIRIISDMATQIATAAEEQSHVTLEITQNTTAIKDVTDRLAEDAEDARRQAESLSIQADSLNAKVSTFTV